VFCWLLIPRPVLATDNKEWAAKWIWNSGEANPTNYFLMVRKNFELASKPDSAILHITSANRYKAFLNGKYIGRGPARSDPRWKSFDSYQVAELLAPGRNTIAVLAYHYGPGLYKGYRGNACAAGERAGLWAQLEITSRGVRNSVATGSDWLVRRAESWRSDIPPINTLVGYPELYDARKDPVDWVRPDFDDCLWERAAIVPDREREWLTLEPRDVPMMREKEIFPARVVQVGEVIELPVGGYDIGDRVYDLLMKEIHLPLEYAALENGDSLLKNDGKQTRAQARYVRAYGIRDPFLIIDFGRQLFGFPRLRLTAPAGAVIDMAYGQQLVGGRIPPGLPYGDRYIAREGNQTWEVFEYRQFRYLQITLRSRKPVEVESVSLNAYQYPAEQRGHFECSDPLLTKIWQACVDTAYLQMEDVLAVDGQRERVNYVSIDIPQAIYAAYGDVALLKRHFRMIARRESGGLLPIYYPPGAFAPVAPRLLLLWLAQLEEHYQYTGDRNLLTEIYPAAKRQMDWFDVTLGNEGMIANMPYWNWFDWTPADLRGSDFSTNAIYVKALEACVRIAEVVNDKESSKRWRQKAETVRTGLRSYWNKDRNLFEDSFYQGKFTGIFSELANGLSLLTEIATAEQRPRIVSHLRKEPPADMAEVTPIYVREVLWGMTKAGYLEAALELIRGRYGPMVEMFDNPTIWEGWRRFTGEDPIASDDDFERFKQGELLRPHARRSLVHGGVGPALLLSQGVLGVQGIGAGFEECRITVPKLETVAWVRGVFPSVRGDIQVEWRYQGPNLTLDVQLPRDLKTTLAIPPDTNRITHNGRAVTQNALQVTGGKHRVEAKLGTDR
jgi:alpha-L-rhamnosidase